MTGRTRRRPRVFLGPVEIAGYYAGLEAGLRNLGFDALAPDPSVHELADFEYTVRSGPGWLHGGGTLDTDRLIIARRLGLGRAQQETAPTTV